MATSIATVPPFQYPGTLCVSPSDTHKLTLEAAHELEIVTAQNERGTSLYESILPGRTSCLAAANAWQAMAHTFYSNRRYLQDTQALLRSYDPNTVNCSWNESDEYTLLHHPLESDDNFATRFQYLDIKYVEWANHNPLVGHALVLSNYTAPAFNLFLPFISIAIVLILQYARSGTIGYEDLSTALWETLGKRLLGAFSAPNVNGKLYGLMVTSLYFVNVYANIRSCIRFRESFKEIEVYLHTVHKLVDCAIAHCTALGNAVTGLKTYHPFAIHLLEGKERLVACSAILSDSVGRTSSLGKNARMFTAFYRFIKDNTLSGACKWAAGFLGYCEIITCLQEKIASSDLAFCSFSKSVSTFTQLRHPNLMSTEAVPNTISLAKNIVVTGPNASGKTTIVKAILLNSLLSQQFGVGTYKKAKIKLAKGMHCYMNVPDTVERDSLFQAEARRCKDILDILKTQSGPHLCLFDELYSGTNPVEAAGATAAYLAHVADHYPDTRFLLTTHLVSVCTDLADQASNMKMEGEISEDSFVPSYICSPGVSTIRSGYLVLKELGYPDDIIRRLNTFVEPDN
jgi:hypothetical protein